MGREGNEGICSFSPLGEQVVTDQRLIICGASLPPQLKAHALPPLLQSQLQPWIQSRELLTTGLAPPAHPPQGPDSDS